jgi:hypothetical protein
LSLPVKTQKQNSKVTNGNSQIRECPDQNHAECKQSNKHSALYFQNIYSNASLIITKLLAWPDKQSTFQTVLSSKAIFGQKYIPFLQHLLQSPDLFLYEFFMFTTLKISLKESTILNNFKASGSL